MDKLVKALNSSGEFSIVACNTLELMSVIANNQGLVTGFSNVVSDVVNANVLMSASLKNDKEELEIILSTDGMLSRVVSTGNSFGEFKGYSVLNNEQASAIIGNGILEVVKYYEGKELFSSKVAVASEDISSVMTDYYFQSEQVYSAVALASLVDKKTNEVYASGGILIQLLPNASEQAIGKVENCLRKLNGLSKAMALGMSVDDMIYLVDSKAQILAEQELKFNCNCSKEQILESISTVDKAELIKIIEEDGQLQVICNGCNKAYYFNLEDIVNI